MTLAGQLSRRFRELLFEAVRRRSTVVITCLLLGTALLVWLQAPLDEAAQYSVQPKKPFEGGWDYIRDRSNLMLNSSQCVQAFPGLFDEIQRPVRARSHRKITLQEIDSIEPRNGYVRAMIVDQQVRSDSFRITRVLA
jgi:hypothetical protein